MFDLFDSSSGWGRFGNALGDYATKRSPMLGGLYSGYDAAFGNSGSEGPMSKFQNPGSPEGQNQGTGEGSTASDSSLIPMNNINTGASKGIVGTIIPAYGMIRKFSEMNREKTDAGEGDNPFKDLVNGNEDPTEKAGMMASAQQGMVAPAGSMQSFANKHNDNSGLISAVLSLI